MRQSLPAWALGVVLASGAFAASEDSEARRILESNCFSCHGVAKMAGLDLRQREAMLKGGSRGPAVVPGNPSQSVLYRAVTRQGDLQMPPGKKALDPAQVEALRLWIEKGAPWNAAVPTNSQTAWWSFRPPQRPPIPTVRSAVQNPIDNFVLHKLAEKGLTPNPPASREKLARRAYFDLHGLPPTPAEIDAFLQDTSDTAYERLIDRLLASPRYAERWGRRWLDVVRYADTGGYETDVSYANAWRYRDYVIESFHRDKPYNVFVQEQIAADELWPTDFEREGGYFIPKHKQELIHKRLGTGLYTIGPMSYEYALHVENYRAEWQADAVETTAAAFLGLTFGCARCHDHKFDPITQKDYYRMAAIFAGSEDREIPLVGQYGIFEYTRFVPRLQTADQIKAHIQRLDAEAGGKPTAEQRDLRETLLRKLGEAYLKAPKRYDSANVLAHSDLVPDTHVLIRGEFSNKGEKVTPGFPASLNAGPEIEEPQSGPFVPQRRKALALWITAKDQPLLARVMVNRIWQGHFGTGIVATPNDFGRQGEPPSHPELLDWLAVEFAERGWSIKSMHKLIMLSNTYRQSDRWNEANGKRDADNVYLWRMNRRRLEAEEIRDAVLAVSGRLNDKRNGPPVVVPLNREELDGIRDPAYWPVNSDPAEHNRRSVYLYVKRSFRMPMFENFDAPDPSQSCARRDVSTVAPQALTMMNSDFVRDGARHLAARLSREASPDARVSMGFRLVTGRAPTAAELARGKEFLQRGGLESFCLLLLNLNEFLYVD
jgi:mono/diheme cytochrome c family protein